MQEGKRQKQVSGLIQQELNTIFQRIGLNIIKGSLVSIASVKITPDLLEARIYLSIFNTQNPKEIIKIIEEKQWEVKKELAARVKTQLRRIPEMKYFLDDTLDQVFKMEELLNKIKEEDNKIGDAGNNSNSLNSPSGEGGKL